MLSLTSQDIQLHFLSQKELFALYPYKTKARNARTPSNEIMMDFLKRLKVIDSRVSVLAPEGVASPTWCYERFIKEFNRIANDQAIEIKAFLKRKYFVQDEETKEEMALLEAFDENTEPHKIQLNILEQRHHALDVLNTALIKPKIDLSSAKLNLNELNITRIPESLFRDPEYQDYLKQVKTIDCGDNELQALPDSLVYCQALQTLYCYGNQLKNLPETLGNCPTLKWLYCNDNKLKSLPESLGNCLTLQGLFCNGNQLQTLPESLGHCQWLQELFCHNNQLKTLPEHLGHCQRLQSLDCQNNQLQDLPESLHNCQMLKMLDFGNNQLKALPETLGNCQTLQFLSCDNNQLQTLPESLGNCLALRMLECSGNHLIDIPSALKNILGVAWYNEMISQQTKPAKSISPNIKQNPETLIQAATKTQDDHRSKIDITITSAKKNGANKLAIALISIILFSCIFAIIGNFTFVAELLLKATFILPATKAAFAAIYLFLGLITTTFLFGLYHLGIFFKTTAVRYLQSSDQRFEADNKACDEQLAQLTMKFSTDTIQSFIQPLNDIQRCVPHSQLIQFKQFEIATCKKVIDLKDEARNQTKAAALIRARKFHGH
ncbi:MAG: leucine-rich repeat domain-containing protein [Proteobacteria bacterium]|nr:leucine-rich repeat domain-containing protein [Pseudomonadota bacterium]